jgi:hypothetical protein
MAVTNETLKNEIQINRRQIRELATSIIKCGERTIALETWRNGHDKNVHAHLKEQIKAAQHTQERQGDRLWKVALQVANLAVLTASLTKLAGAW